ncbi:hypothetical protein SAY87_001223 [Trapa incisa]|uniref:Uncharacterized protein n=1 Tax=Trapa incisa TaxID=236973 RepID=A0AAN7GP81_9MYRT|nr:hypothetical protein SAY87_001223 [Trapa incisa]
MAECDSPSIHPKLSESNLNRSLSREEASRRGRRRGSAVEVVAWKGLLYAVFILHSVLVCQILLLQPIVAALDGKSSDIAELLEKASQNIKLKLYNEALNDLNTAIDVNPTLFEESEKSYRKYLELKPGNTVAENKLSQLLQAENALETADSTFGSGDYAKSMEYLDKVVLVFCPACQKVMLWLSMVKQLFDNSFLSDSQLT